MTKKQRQRELQQLNFQRQLEALGVKIASMERAGFNTTQVSFLGTEFLNTLRDLDSQQNTNKYIWEGLPDYLPSWLVENMLYNRAVLCGYIKGGVLYILPFAQAKGIDIWGIPKAVKPITYNGQSTGKENVLEELPTIHNGSIEGAKAVILYDRIPVYNSNSAPLARSVLNQELIRYQADLLGRVKNNIQNADKKMVFYVENESQVNQMTNDLINAYGNELPFIVLVRNGTTNDGKADGPLQSNIDIVTQALFETWQSLNSIRCMVSGIANGGAFEKKERKIYGELQGDSVQTDLVLDGGLRMRRLFLEQMKSIYPEYAEMLNKITVRINEQTINYDEKDTDEGGEDYDTE